MTTVKNATDTSDKSCKCGTWLDHWKNFSDKSLPLSCRELSCPENKLVGAHVRKVNSTDTAVYIIPLCQSHNQMESSFNVMDGYFVSADKSKTCEK